VKILFVEDNPELIEQLVWEINFQSPDWEIRFAEDIPMAWLALCADDFDAVVLDIMLPSWPSAPSRDEGFHLLRNLLGEQSDENLKALGTPRDANRNAFIVILTSRSTLPAEVPGEVGGRKVLKAKDLETQRDGAVALEPESVLVLYRLEKDALQLYEIIKNTCDRREAEDDARIR
jgi:CheY-like chemotaxis protein